MASPKRLEDLFLGAGRFRGKFLGERIVGALLIPKDADDPPTSAIIEQLNAVDPAGERGLSRSMAGFVAAEDLRDVSECFNPIHDGTFKESVLQKVIACTLGVVFDAHRANARGAVRILYCGRETSLRQKQGAETIPVAYAGRTGDHTVKSGEDAVDGLDVFGACGRHICRRRRSLRRRLLLGCWFIGRLGGGRERKSEDCG